MKETLVTELPAEVLDDVGRVTAQLLITLMNDPAFSPTVAINSAIRLLIILMINQQVGRVDVTQFIEQMYVDISAQISANPSGATH